MPGGQEHYCWVIGIWKHFMSLQRINQPWFASGGGTFSTTMMPLWLKVKIRNTVKNVAQFQALSGDWISSGGDDNYGDCYGHGTHVAARAVGQKYGIARNARLFSVGNNTPLSVLPIST
jgi:subtilisin family serine protease